MFQRTYDKLVMKLLAPVTQRAIENQVKASAEQFVKELATGLADNSLRNLQPIVLEILIAANANLDIGSKTRLLDAFKKHRPDYLG